jgi:hypothetical protein
VRCRERDAKWNIAPQLEQLYSIAPSELNCFVDQCANPRVGAERSPVIQKGHRDKIVSEDNAPDPNERQRSNELVLEIARDEINAFMPEGALDNVTPPEPVKLRISTLSTGERVPLLLASGELFNPDRQAAPSAARVDALASSCGRYEAMVPNRNSSRSRSTRASAPSSPR